MAKQEKKPVGKVAPKSKSEGTGTGGYILRNLAILAGLLIIYAVFAGMFTNEHKISELTQQFYDMRAHGARDNELQPLYNQIMELQREAYGDTGYLKKLTRGYDWAINELAISNLESIKNIKEEIHQSGEDSTAQSLLQAKLKRKVGLYNFIDYINKSTPKDAVILLPEGDAEVSNNSKWNFIYDPEWMEYFIYPRLCLAIGRENEHPDLAKRITHVVIIEGKGYDKLKYNVPLNQRPKEAVLPYDQPPPGLVPDTTSTTTVTNP